MSFSLDLASELTVPKTRPRSRVSGTIFPVGNQTGRRPGRPYGGGPKAQRKLRMDEPWATAARIAELRGETMNEVVARKLGEYVEEFGHLLKGAKRAA